MRYKLFLWLWLWTGVSRLPPLILLRHLFLNCTSFWNRPKLSMSSLIQAHRVFFERRPCLIPSISNVLRCLTESVSSLRSSCPNNLILLFLIIKLTGSNPDSFFLSYSLFFLTFSLSRYIHLIILNYVWIHFNSCSTFIGQVSLPCIRQLLTTQVAYIFPFSFNENPFPVTTSKYSLIFFHVDLTLAVTAESHHLYPTCLLNNRIYLHFPVIHHYGYPNYDQY